jgi:hypothetical protein
MSNILQCLKGCLWCLNRAIYFQDNYLRCGSEGAVWLIRVRCGSDSSAPACCTAGPGSNLGSAPRAESNEDNKSGALGVVYIKYCMSARLM